MEKERGKDPEGGGYKTDATGKKTKSGMKAYKADKKALGWVGCRPCSGSGRLEGKKHMECGGSGLVKEKSESRAGKFLEAFSDTEGPSNFKKAGDHWYKPGGYEHGHYGRELCSDCGLDQDFHTDRPSRPQPEPEPKPEPSRFNKRDMDMLTGRIHREPDYDEETLNNVGNQTGWEQ
jgi:hypothetical protein